MDVFKDIVAPIVGWLIIVTGWVVVARGQGKQETRRDVRAIINDIKKLVLEVETRAFEYYRLPPDKAHEAGLLLKQQLTHVGTLVTSLTRQNAKIDVASALVDFRSKVTGGDFESFQRQPRAASDPLMSEIAMAAHQFLDAIEASFTDAYK